MTLLLTSCNYMSLITIHSNVDNLFKIGKRVRGVEYY